MLSTSPSLQWIDKGSTSLVDTDLHLLLPAASWRASLTIKMSCEIWARIGWTRGFISAAGWVLATGY